MTLKYSKDVFPFLFHDFGNPILTHVLRIAPAKHATTQNVPQLMNFDQNCYNTFLSFPKCPDNSLIPGVAIVILEITTCVIPVVAAFFDFPTGLSFSSNTTIPSIISLKVKVNRKQILFKTTFFTYMTVHEQ